MFDFTKRDYAETSIHPIIWERLVEYAQTGREVGGFLTSVLENNFKEAVARADRDNLLHIRAIMLFIANELPAQCQGSKDRMRWWRSYITSFQCSCRPWDGINRDCEETHPTYGEE